MPSSPLHGSEDVMATRWSDLSVSSRRLIIAAAIGEAVLKTAVLIDIRRRPASQIRGSKRMWIVAAVLVNSAGVGPLSYFAFGRRHAEGDELPAPARAE
jgi:Phospholipase_D-nuclease N-terminal